MQGKKLQVLSNCFRFVFIHYEVIVLQKTFPVQIYRRSRISTRNLLIYFSVILLFVEPCYDLFVRFFSGAAWGAMMLLTAVFVSIPAWPCAIVSKQIIFFLPFLFLYCFFAVVSPNATQITLLGLLPVNIQVYQMFTQFLILIIADYLFRHDSFDKMVVCILAVSLIVNSIFTFRAINLDPNISKIMSTGSISAYTDIDSFGIVGFAYNYSLVFLIPVLIRAVQVAKTAKNKIIIMGILVLSAFLLYKCGYFIAIMLVALLFVLWIFFSVSGLGKLILMIATAGIVFLTKMDWFPVFLINISQKTSVYNVAERLRQVAAFLATGRRGDTLARLNLYENALKSFADSPLIGNALLGKPYLVSGHATCLDMLADGGLLLFSLFVVFLVVAYRESRAFLEEKQQIILKTVYISFFAMTLCDPIFASPQILFTVIYLIPMLLRFPKSASSISENNAEGRGENHQ